MLINGHVPETFDYNAVRQALIDLPNAVQSRTAAPTYNVGIHQSVFDVYAAAVSTHEDWQIDKDNNKLREAILRLEDAADFVRQDGNPLGYAMLMNASITMRYDMNYYQNLAEKIPTLQAVAEENNYANYLANALNIRHAMLLEQYEVIQNWIGSDAEQLQALEQQMHQVRLQAIDGMFHWRGEEKDDDAVRVEQGEIGISADKRIGPYNVHECVCVAIRDPVTGTTALAHFGNGFDASSLQIALDRLPKTEGIPWQVKIVGAAYGDSEQDEGGKERSNGNLRKVLDFLRDKDVDIIAADIMDSRQPLCFVLEPASFDMREAEPRINPDTLLAYAMIYMKEAESRSNPQLQFPLRLAFDFTASPEYAPITLSRDNVAEIQKEIIGRNTLGLAKRVNSPAESLNGALQIECERQLGIAYQRAIDDIIKVFSEKSDSLSASGCQIEDSDKFVSGLLKCPIHVGKNAAIANQPLVSWIQENAFVVVDNVAYPNVIGIDQFQFNGQSYDAVEASHPILPKQEAMRRAIEQYRSGNTPQPQEDSSRPSPGAIPDARGEDKHPPLP